MEALAFLYFRCDMLLGKRSEPVFHITLAADLGTETEVSISTFEKVHLFGYVDSTLVYIIHMKQGFKHARLVFRMNIGSHLLHIHRNNSSTFLRNGIEIVAART